MIKRLRKFKFSPAAFLKGMPDFVLRYLKTRPHRLLILAIPGLLFSAVLLFVFVVSGHSSTQEAIRRRYVDLVQQSLQQNDPEAAEFYLARILQLSEDPKAEQFRFARQLYEMSDVAEDPSLLVAANSGIAESDGDPYAQRAMGIMASLAPRRPNVGGYLPAHQFLGKYWRSRKPQSDITVLLALQHEMYSQPDDREPAIRLADFLFDRHYYRHAIETLKPHQTGNADVLKLLARSYSKNNDAKSANQCLAQAVQLLQRQLEADPENSQTRLELSALVAAQGQLLESMFVLVPGLGGSRSEKVVDELVQRYTIWLSLMDTHETVAQLAEVELALKYLPNFVQEKSGVSEYRNLTLSTGESFSLPAPVVSFHAALLNGNGSVLGPLLLGTEEAARGQFDTAVTLLDRAHHAAPDHPVVANNLAWALVKQSEKPVDHPGEEGRSLERAWKLANLAVSTCPGIASFRETRGTLAVLTKRWRTAVDDLQICVESGNKSISVRQNLTLAEEKLKAVEGA